MPASVKHETKDQDFYHEEDEAQCLAFGLHYIPKRYIMTFLSMLGSMVVGVFGTNFSVAIVVITSPKNVTEGNVTITIPPEFNWTSFESGFLISAFSIGFLLTVFGGGLVVKFGGANIFGFCTAMISILTLLFPYFLQTNLIIFTIGKIIHGFVEGMVWVGLCDTFAHWSPPQEKTKLTSYNSIGYNLGVCVTYPLGGYIAASLGPAVLGWRALFYIPGVIGLVWSVVWMSLIKNDPSQDRCITKSEKIYLKVNITEMSMSKVSQL